MGVSESFPKGFAKSYSHHACRIGSYYQESGILSAGEHKTRIGVEEARLHDVVFVGNIAADRCRINDFDEPATTVARHSTGNKIGRNWRAYLVGASIIYLECPVVVPLRRVQGAYKISQSC